MFSIVYDPNTSANELNKDLQKISEWGYQWKMSFKPDQNKQVQEVIFSRKKKSSHPQINFNNMPVFSVNFQKYLGIYLHEKLNFNYHIKGKTKHNTPSKSSHYNIYVICQAASLLW